MMAASTFNGRYHFHMRMTLACCHVVLETDLAQVAYRGEPAAQNVRRGLTPIALRTFKEQAISAQRLRTETGDQWPRRLRISEA